VYIYGRRYCEEGKEEEKGNEQKEMKRRYWPSVMQAFPAGTEIKGTLPASLFGCDSPTITAELASNSHVGGV
jgi:hypothetical protein